MNHYHSQKRAFWVALLMSVIFIGLSYLLNFYWETNDDPSIAILLSRQTNNYSPFQWRLLSRILHRMYLYFSGVDWWAVSSVFAIWCSAFACTYVIYRRYPARMAFLLSTVLLTLLWLVACNKVNFTRTAAVVAIAGILLIANCVFPALPSRFLSVEYVVGCFLMLYGASIRSTCGWLALAFLAVIGLVKLLSDRFSLKRQWFQDHLRQMLLLCLAALLFFGASALNKAQLTESQKEYLAYNRLRSSLMDYSSNYPSFQEASEAYLEAGWNEIGTEVFFDWFSEDTDVFTMEAMEQVSNLYEPAHDFKKLRSLTKIEPEIVYYALFTVLLLCCYKKRNWIYGLVTCGVFGALCVYLAAEGRFPPRVYQPMMLGAVGMAMLLCSGSCLPDSVPEEPFGPAVNLHYMKQVAAVLLSVGFILNLFAGLSAGHSYYTATKETREYEKQRTNVAEVRSLLDAMDADREHLYLFDIRKSPASVSNSFAFFDIPPGNYCENRFSLGGWSARSPYRVSLLASYGVTNPTTALFERTDVYSTYSARLLKYLHAYYDPHITASGTKTIDGTQFVQYTKPVDDDLVIADPAKRVVIDEFSCTDSDDADAYYLSATINDSADRERVFYCNLDVNGNRCTYRLKCEGNRLSGILYDTGDIPSLEAAQIRIFEKTETAYLEYSSGTVKVDLLPYLSDAHDCSLSKVEGGLLLTDTGTDAQIIFSMPDRSGLPVTGVAVEMDVQTPSAVQLFVATQEAGYSEKQSTMVTYDAGRVTLVLQSPSDQPVSLRLDPTAAEGEEILLRSVELMLTDQNHTG